MELRHLRYLVAIVECRSITAAAKAMNLAQPALSQQIKALEKEIGVTLFHRVGRGVGLTLAGQRFADDAQRILDRSRAAILSAQQIARGDVGSLAIGLMESAGFSPHVTGPIQNFRKAFPQVHLSLLEGRSEELARSLADRRADVAFMRPPVPAGADLTSLPVLRERLIVCVARDHHLARLRRISIEDLAGETLIWPRRRSDGTGISQRLFSLLEKKAVVLKGLVETAEFATAVNMAATGLGVALVPESLQGLRRDAVTTKTLHGSATLYTEIVLVNRTDLESTIVTNFKAFFGEFSSKPAIGSRPENALKQESGAPA